MKKRYWAIAVLIVCIVAVSVTFINLKAYADIDKNIICEGIYIDSLYIGGLTKEQAESAVDEYIKSLQEAKVTINVKDATVETTLGELGKDAKDYTFIEDALQAGKSGNLIKRYKELKDIEVNNIVYNLEFTDRKSVV